MFARFLLVKLLFNVKVANLLESRFELRRLGILLVFPISSQNSIGWDGFSVDWTFLQNSGVDVPIGLESHTGDLINPGGPAYGEGV